MAGPAWRTPGSVTMTLDLGSLKIDEVVLLQQLRQDLKDDWFPDARAFEDVLASRQFETVLIENFAANAGAYKAPRADVLNVPKSNFTLRYALETSIADRALYQGLAAALAPYFDPLLPWQVFNHRLRAKPGERDQGKRRSGKRYLFNGAIESWRNFIGSVQSSLDGTTTLLSTDLTNYYENINLETLRNTMLDLLPEVSATPAQKAALRNQLSVLFECLSEWCYRSDRGLPQNRDASSFLANVYMLPVDRAMIAAGYSYFRYMDDIKIVCRDIFHARRALKDLTLELRKVGLSVNSGKTEICEPNDTDKISTHLDHGGRELQQLSAVWQTRSLKPISRSFSALKALTLKLLTEGGINKRAFRFCIRRMEALAVCPEFAVPLAYFAEITPLVIEALTTHPSATDQLVRYLRSVQLTDDQLAALALFIQDKHKTTYTWQCYCLWLLLLQKEYKCPELLKYATSLLESAPDDANRSGAVLYAGALGGDAERQAVARTFNRVRSYHGQRAALVAAQELDYKTIKSLVQPHIRADLVGVYRGLGRQGIYFAQPAAEPITNFLDLGRDYD